MPSLSSQSTTFRRGGYTYTGYISTPPLTVVLAGTVTAVPTYPALAIAYSLDSGSAGAALPDLTVNFYSSGGTKKATLRIATGATVTSTSLKVNEFSQGVYDVAIGDTFEVIQAWSIWDRLVAATSTLDKDSRIAYTDQNENQNPVANSGGVSAGFGTTRAFYGDTSFTIDPDSSGTLAHLWDYIDGSGTTNVANPSGVTFPVGFRDVKHTVTDSSNSKSTIQYVQTFVHDNDTYPPLAVQMDSLSGTVDSGWRCSFKLPVGSESDISTLPDGAMIVYWEVERYNNTEASYGSNVTGKSNVKFVGYLISESIHIDPDQNEVTFEAVSPLAILEQTPSLPQLMVSNNTPSKWSEVKGLSTKKMFAYLSYWHSSLQDVFDFVWNDGLDISYERVAVEGQTLAEQLRDIANSLNLQVTCDRLGRILFTRDPVFLTTVQRSSRTKTYDLTTADAMAIDITRQHRGNAKTVRGEGITSNNDPIFSNSPGDAPASFGIASDTLAKQIVNSINELLDRTEKYFAKINGLYNGQFVPKGTRVKLPDGYDVFDPAYREFVTLTLPANTNKRGIVFTTATKWTVEAVDISYDLDAGSKDITITIDHETDGDGAVVYTPPQEGENGLPDLPDVTVDFPSMGFDPGTGLGIDPGATTPAPVSPATKTMSAFLSDNTMRLTANFNHPEGSGGPTWDSTDLTALSGWGSGNLIAFEVDPYSPAYVGTGDEVNGVFITDECAQRIEDIFGTPTLGTAFTFTDTTEARTMALDRNVEGFGIVASWVLGDGVYAAITLDGGATWDEDLVTAFENTAASGIAPGCWISPHTAGKAYISAWTTTGDNATAEASIYRTLDYGATWSHLTSPDIDSGVDVSSFIGVPFSNTAGARIFHRNKLAAGGLQLVRNISGTETDITPETSIQYVPIGQRGHEIALPEDSTNTLAMIGATGAAIAGLNWDIFGANHGVILSQGAGSLTIEASDGGNGNYYVMIKSANQDSCSYISSYDVLSGTVDQTGDASWTDCGEPQVEGVPQHPFGLFGFDSYCVNYFQIQSSLPFTVKIIFGDGCEGDSGAVDYALLETENAYDAEPTWVNLDSGQTFPYRQVYSLGSGKYLLIGLEGSIGIADSGGVDSRRGNITSTGEVVGTAGA